MWTGKGRFLFTSSSVTTVKQKPIPIFAGEFFPYLLVNFSCHTRGMRITAHASRYIRTRLATGAMNRTRRTTGAMLH